MKPFDPSDHGAAGKHLADLRDACSALPDVAAPTLGTSGTGEITLKFPDVTAYARYSMRNGWILSLRQRGGTYHRGVKGRRLATRADVVAAIRSAVG